MDHYAKVMFTTALDITDDILLRRSIGLDTNETRMLRTIWQKLRDRRINRKPDNARRIARRNENSRELMW